MKAVLHKIVLAFLFANSLFVVVQTRGTERWDLNSQSLKIIVGTTFLYRMAYYRHDKKFIQHDGYSNFLDGSGRASCVQMPRIDVFDRALLLCGSSQGANQ